VKVCPTCQREYSDELTFCSDDGADLVVRNQAIQRAKALVSPEIKVSPGINRKRILTAAGALILLVLGRVWWIGSGGWINTPFAAINPWRFPPYIIPRAYRPWRWQQGDVSLSRQSRSMEQYRPVIVPPQSTSSPAEEVAYQRKIEAATRPEIELLYRRSEQGFRDKNLSEYFYYTATRWISTNDDGSRETRDQAWIYMSKLFQGSMASREHTVGIRREVIKVSPLIGESDGYLVHVWVVVSKSTGQEVRYKQTDTWIDAPENPGLLCVGEIRGVWQEDSGK
jgi:hypothetical protein